MNDYNYYANLSSAEFKTYANDLITLTKRIYSITNRERCIYNTISSIEIIHPDLYGKWITTCYAYICAYAHRTTIIKNLHKDLIPLGYPSDIESFIFEHVVAKFDFTARKEKKEPKRMTERALLNSNNYTASFFTTIAANIVRDIHKKYFRTVPPKNDSNVESKKKKKRSKKSLPYTISLDKPMFEDEQNGNITTLGDMLEDETFNPSLILDLKELNAAFYNQHVISNYIYKTSSCGDLDHVIVTMAILNGEKDILGRLTSIKSSSDLFTYLNTSSKYINEEFGDNLSIEKALKLLAVATSAQNMLFSNASVEIKLHTIQTRTKKLRKDMCALLNYKPIRKAKSN